MDVIIDHCLNINQAGLHLSPGEDYIYSMLEEQKANVIKSSILKTQIKDVSSINDSINIDDQFNLSHLMNRP